MSSLLVLLVCLLVLLWTDDELRQTRKQIKTTRNTYISSQKDIIRTQVKQAVDYIQHKRSSAKRRVKNEVKSRTYEAYSTALYIYNKHKKTKSLGQIKNLVYDALYASTWDGGKGYYFAENMVGTELMNRNNPELEGKNILNVQDSKGKYLVKEIIAVAKSPAQEGFCSYHWNKPEYPGVFVPKISYVKYFKPLDWVIGNGKYVVDEEETIKKEVIERIGKIRFGDKGYIFVGTWDGLSLSGPFTGKNMLHTTDANGVKIVEKLIVAAKSGGGFVGYVSPKYKGKPPVSKISYAQPIKAWKWYVGTGLYVDEIETVIKAKRKRIKETIRLQIIKSILIVCVFLFFSFILVWYLSSKIKKNLKVFSDFFKRSAKEALPIEGDKIYFNEFQSLVASANKMSDEKRRSEKALRKSEQQLSIHLKKTPVGSITWDMDFKAIKWNPAAEKIFGYTKEEAMGKHPSELIVPTQFKEATNKYFDDMVTRKGGGEQISGKNNRKDGKKILCNWYNTALTDADGKVTGVASLINDITEIKQTEELMIQTEKMVSMGSLAAGIAHEINNPLAGMLQAANVITLRFTSLGMAANHKACEEAGTNMDAIASYIEKRGILRMVTIINESGVRIAEIIANMLGFARKGDTSVSNHNPVDLLDKILKLAATEYDLKEHYAFRAIEIEKEYEENLPLVRCEGAKIQQVLLNILRNGAQAMQENIAAKSKYKPKFILRMSHQLKSDMLCIEIEDNGPGMDEDTSKRIFEPFFTTKPVGAGTGLGLSLSYYIITENHGGEMFVESDIGSGTKFIIMLPLNGTRK
jgi:PAS domain S-box-containing protein